MNKSTTFLFFAALIAIATLTGHVSAQTPEPPGVQLGPPRYDADGAVYLLEISCTGLDRSDSLQISLVNAEGVMQRMPNYLTSCFRQVLKIDAGGLEVGAQYTIEVRAFKNTGEPILENGGSDVLAVRTFRHMVDMVQLESMRFEIDEPGQALVIAADIRGSEAAASYHVIFEDAATHTVAFDQALAGTLPLQISLSALPSGQYKVSLQALGANGQKLAETSGEFSYIARTPGLIELLLRGLAARPLLPVAILLIFAVLTGWSILTLQRNRSQTATPVLQALDQRSWKGRIGPAQPASPTAPGIEGYMPSRLLLTISASPDRFRVGQEIEIDHFPFSIGREGCDLSLQGDSHISRRHVELRYAVQGLCLVDLLSQNGTWVDGKRIAAETPIWLDPNERIDIYLGRDTVLRIGPTPAHKGLFKQWFKRSVQNGKSSRSQLRDVERNQRPL